MKAKGVLHLYICAVTAKNYNQLLSTMYHYVLCVSFSVTKPTFSAEVDKMVEATVSRQTALFQNC